MLSIYAQLRRLLGKLLSSHRQSPRQRPLQVLRLEKRRVLSADFSLVGGGLLLDGFDAADGDTLSISSQDDTYRFELAEGESWRTADALPPGGIDVDGSTLAIDSSLLDSLPGGVSVNGGSNGLSVQFGDADFSSLSGPLSLTGVSSLGQETGATLVAPDSPFQLATSPAGSTVSDLNIAGDLVLTAFGPITDAAGTQITVSGNATLISRGVQLPADFDNNGVVEQADYDVWAANFGQTPGPLTPGDANDDGAINAADFTIWRDSLGEIRTGGGITLADNAGDLFTVGGETTFIAEDVGGRFDISVGEGGQTEFGAVSATGDDVVIVEDTPLTLDQIDAKSLDASATGTIDTTVGASINVAEDATLLSQTMGGITIQGANNFTVGGAATLNASDGGGAYDVLVDQLVDTDFGSLGVIGATVDIQEDSGSELRFVTADSLALSSTGGITDSVGAAIEVAGKATFTATGDITLGDDPSDTTNFGSLAVSGMGVTVQEDSGTQLTGVTADMLSLTSDGAITDAVGTTIEVAGMATFDAGANPITLGDDPTDTTNFGSLSVTGSNLWIQEDSDTELKLVSADTFTLTSDGSITDIVGAPIEVAGQATLTASGNITLGDDPSDTTNFGSLAVSGTSITIQEDSSTELTGVSADMLSLTSDGAITDSAGATIEVVGMATFDAGMNPITLGDDPTDTTNFGSLSVTGSDVSITEDSDTELKLVSADTFTLDTDGSITDIAEAPIEVAGQATLTTTGDITLGDDPSDSTNFGSLAVSGTTVSIREDSGSELTGVTADMLSLTSDGAITDAVGTTIEVAGMATFDAGMNPITLGDDPTDTTNFGSLSVTGSDVSITEDSDTELKLVSADTFTLDTDGAITDIVGAPIEVAGQATLTAAGDITLGDDPSDTTNFGSLAVSGTTVSIQEDSSTELTGVSADMLSLTADGAITDSAGASIEVVGLATFDAGSNPITLGDELSDTTNFGSLDAAGSVITIQEDSSTEIAGLSATTLNLTSDGEITDLPPAVIEVLGDAVFVAGGQITLANAGADNQLGIGGNVSLTSGGGGGIDLGVDAAGDPAPAVAVVGTLQFNTDGSLRLALDGGLVIGGGTPATSESTAQFAFITADGAITDSPGADTTIAQAAELNSTEDIVLGDDARFAMAEAGGTEAAPFDPSRYLAVAAQNVSVIADSSVNLRTTAVDPAILGSFFLTAKGTIAQIIDAQDDASRLSADRVAVRSEEGAVLLSRVELTSAVSGDDSTAPNLAVHAGGVESFLATIAPRAEEFPVDRMPSAAVTELSPIALSPSGTEGQRPDGSGLIDREGAQVLEPSPIGDGYSAVVVVLGDAKIGAVTDATQAQADLVGVAVSGEGNAFVETLATESLDEALAETGDLVFSRFGSADETVVEMAGGVFTAVAAGGLLIDTEQPEAQIPATARTTKLSSATGTVTSVSEHTTFDSELSEAAGASVSVVNSGPRLVLDPASEEADAATTGLVLAPEFEQRITLAVGSRAEDGLVVELEYADVINPREPDRPDLPGSERDRLPLAPNTPGAVENPQVTIAPEAIDANTLDPSLSLTSPTPLGSRLVTVRHNYAEEFIPANPAREALPTTVRVYNDPAINLFQAGGETNLNVNTNTVTPRIITTPPPAYFQPLPPEPPASFPAPQAVAQRPDPSQAPQQNAADEERSAVTASVEVILFGRADDNTASGWAEDVPGEAWPKQWPNGDGDFIQEIKEAVNDSPSSEGRYRIVTVTSRGEQQLEEWVKTDAPVESNEADGFLFDSQDENNAQGQAPEGLPAAPAPEDGAASSAGDLGGGDSGGVSSGDESLAITAAVAMGLAWPKKRAPQGQTVQDEAFAGYSRADRWRRRWL